MLASSTNAATWASAAGTAVASLVAAWAAWSARRAAGAAEEIVKVERDRLEDERRAAREASIQVVPEVVTTHHRDRQPDDRRIIAVRNLGPAPARAVIVTFPPNSAVVGQIGGEDMDPGTRIELVDARAVGDPPKLRYEVSWIDGEGHHAEHRWLHLT